MKKLRHGYELLQYTHDDQSLWRKDETGELYLTDHSGDDAWANPDKGLTVAGSPDETDDGPLRIDRRMDRNDHLIFTPTKRGYLRCNVEVICERTNEENIVGVCDVSLVLHLARLIGSDVSIQTPIFNAN